MYMAIAVETSKNPTQRTNYKVWFLELTDRGDVIGLGVKNREEVVQSLFRNIRRTGKSNWKAFAKNSEASKPIEIYDFISQSTYENTHFGNLPTLHEFQETLNRLQLNLELKPIACKEVA